MSAEQSRAADSTKVLSTDSRSNDLGLSKTEKRFPTKNTCLAIYSRVVNAETSLADVLATNFPWCAEWEGELKKLFGSYVEAKQRQNVLDYYDLLLYWAQMMQEGEIAREVCSRFDHVLATSIKIQTDSRHQSSWH